MSVEQLLVVLPDAAEKPTGSELTQLQWSGLLEQFVAQGGRELLLGGAEPLRYPGFWVLVKRGLKANVSRVSAYLSGSLLEPWVLRGLVESGIHVLIALDSLVPDHHEALHGPGSHSKALAAVETLLKQGLSQRVGILATATRLTYTELPMLTAWAAGRGLARFLWTTVPDGGWPAPSLKALRLSPEEKTEMAALMDGVSRQFAQSIYTGPLDLMEDHSLGTYSRLLRVTVQGEACWGFSGEGGRLGNLKRALLTDLLTRSNQAVGD